MLHRFTCAVEGMGKVRGATLRGGNLRGVMRGMRLLVSDFP